MDMVFPPVVGEVQGKLVVWDSCRAHISNDVKSYMKNRGILSSIIPGGLTCYVQAGDIGIYKSFKDNLLSELGKRLKKDRVTKEI